MTALATELETEPSARSRRFDVVTLLTVYLVLLMGIPQALQFAPLGGVGQPSTVLAVILVGIYVLAWLHPASPLYRGRQPIENLPAFCGTAR